MQFGGVDATPKLYIGLWSQKLAVRGEIVYDVSGSASPPSPQVEEGANRGQY